MNYASKIVKGKYIKIVDSDDEINKKTFNEILFFLKSKVPNDIDICAVPFTIYNENEQKNIQKRNGIFKRKPYILQLANKKLNFFIFTHHMLIFKKEIFINACPLVEKYFYSDNLLIFKTLVNTEKIYIFSKKIVSYKYYVGNQEQSISINNYINRREHVFNVYKKILETKIPKNISENKKKYIVDFIFNILYLLVLLTILDKKNTNVETNNIIDGYLQTTKQFKSKELILSSFYYKIICNKNLRTLLRIINKFIYKFAWFGFFKAIKS
jgi:hypothetical protein